MDDTPEVESIARKFIGCINEHDAAGIIALCTSTHIFTDSLGNQLSGLSNLKQGWRGYFALFPDYRIEIDVVASNSDLVLVTGSAAATHAPSGATWHIPAAWRARVLNGRISEWQVFADNKPVYEILSSNA